MNFLKNIHKQQKIFEKQKDLSKLPPDVVSDIEKNIRDGAKDLEQNWSNALELVHRAYLVAGVQRPTPDMKDAWEQYESMIQYAVEQLSKHRGMDGDWRMSASMFFEAFNQAQTLQEREQKQKAFRVTIKTGNSKETYITHAEQIDQVIDAIKDKDTNMHDLDIDQIDKRTIVIRPSKFGIKRNVTIKVEQLKQM